MLNGPRVDGSTRLCCLLMVVLMSAASGAQTSDMQCGASGVAGLALGGQSTTLEPWIYVAWASHCDATPYNGIVASFSYSIPLNKLTLDSAFYTQSSTGDHGGIWMSGAAPAVTSTPESTIVTDVYLSSGNGLFTPGQIGARASFVCITAAAPSL